jgi:hypothetical protein
MVLIIYISIFLLLNFIIYFVTKKYDKGKSQIIFILFLIISIHTLCNIFENNVTVYTLLQLSKFSVSIPIFVFSIRLISDKAKLKYQYKYPFLSFIWNKNFDISLFFTKIFLSLQLFMLLTESILH